MSKFQANSADGYIVTSLQNQDGGQGDWVKYKVNTKDKSYVPVANSSTISQLITKSVDNIDPFGDGLEIAFYKFEGNANDEHGSYNGTETNVTYETGKFEQCVFTNQDYTSRVELNYSFKLFDESNKTFSCWVANLNSSSCEGLLISAVDSTKNSNRCVFGHQAIDILEGTIINFSKYPQDDDWHYYLFTVGSEGTKVYIDGQLVATDSRTIINDSGTASYESYCIGNNWYNVAHNSSGVPNIKIDHIRIFNRALTPEEINQLYHEELKLKKYDQIVIYNATDGLKTLELTLDKFTDDYTIDISSLSLTQKPEKCHTMIKTKDLIIDNGSTTATSLVVSALIEEPEPIKGGESLVVYNTNDGYKKLDNVTVSSKAISGTNILYTIDISSLSLTTAPTSAYIIKPRIEISTGTNDNEANVDDIVLDVDTTNTTTSAIKTPYIWIPNQSIRQRVQHAKRIDTDTGVDINVSSINEDYYSDENTVDKFGDSSEIAFYKFEGNANDEHGSYNGTWNGTEQYDTGRFGQAAKFDGDINNYIQIPTISLGLNFTLSLWVYIQQYAPERTIFLGNDTNNFYFGAVGSNYAGKGRVAFNLNGTEYTGYLDYDSYSGFVHSVVIVNNGVPSIYLNMQKDTASPPTYNTNLNFSFTLAKKEGGTDTNYSFDGLIDQFRIFNHALTEDEVKALYYEQVGKYTINIPTQSSAPTKAIIRPHNVDYPSLDLANITYDDTNDLILVQYGEIDKSNNTFRSIQAKWNAQRVNDENSKIQIDLWRLSI